MSTKSCIIVDRYERIQGANLIIENKIYPIYRGVNTIGRNKSANVNVKNLNVSQHHAVIVLVDDARHFISDLNSSNGTFLGGSKLIPFNLYELTDEHVIKFGDVTASYDMKVSHLNCSRGFSASQGVADTFYAASTQVMDDETSADHNSSRAVLEDIHEAATQVVIYPPNINPAVHKALTDVENGNIVEMVTSNPKNVCEEIIDDVHNAETQVVVNPTENVIENIHDAKTQVIVIQSENVREEVLENVHEAMSQLITSEPNNLVDCTTSDFNVNKQSDVFEESVLGSFVNTSLAPQLVIEETVIEENVCDETNADLDETSNNSLDFLDEDVKNTQNVINNVISSLESDDSVTCPQTEKVVNSDSETDVEDAEIVGLYKKRSLRKLSSEEDSPNSQVQKNETKGVEQELHIDLECTQDFGIRKRRPVQKLISDEEPSQETDQNEQDQPKEKSPDVNSDSDECTLDIGTNRKRPPRAIPSEEDSQSHKIDQTENSKPREDFIQGREEKTTISDSETDIEEDLLSNSKENAAIIHSDSETDIECDIQERTADSEVIKPVKVSKKLRLESDPAADFEENQKSESQLAENLDDTDYIPATQDAFAEAFQYKTASLEVNQNMSSEESFKLGISEYMIQDEETCPVDENNQNIGDATNEKSYEAAEEVAEEANVAIQENYHGFEIIVNEDLSTLPAQNNNEAPAEGVTETDFDQAETEFKVRHQTEVNEAVRKNDQGFKDVVAEDLFTLPTQNFNEDQVEEVAETGFDQRETENTKTVETVPGKDVEVVNEDFYMLPTQKIDDEAESVKRIADHQTDTEFSLCHEPEGTEAVRENINEDVYVLPTQKMNKDQANIKELIQPQAEFNASCESFNFKKPKAVLDNSLSNILGNKREEDVYLVATQKISEQKLNEGGLDDVFVHAPAQFLDEDIYLAPTQPINEIQVVDEDDDAYMMATQKIVETEPPSTASLDIYRQETEKWGEPIPEGEKKEVSGKMQNEDLYDLLTQQIEDGDVQVEVALPERNKNTPILGDVETLSQIAAFVKKPLDVPNINISTRRETKNSNKPEASEIKMPPEARGSTTQELPKGEVFVLPKIKEESVETAEKINKTETVTPVEACIKKPLDTVVPKSRKSVRKVAKATKREINDPETLSQIEAFVKMSLDEDAPKAKKSKLEETVSSCETAGLAKENVDTAKIPSDDSSHFENPLKDTAETPRTRRATNRPAAQKNEPASKIRLQARLMKLVTSSKNKSEAKAAVVDDPPTNTIKHQLRKLPKVSYIIDNAVRSNVHPSIILSDSKLMRTRRTQKITDVTEFKMDVENKEPQTSKENKKVTDDTILNTTKPQLRTRPYKIGEDQSTTSDNATDDTVKSDVDQSFALLESKLSKTRKGQRVSDMGEIKVTVGNRRSMATRSMEEVKACSRKSRRIAENNNVPPIKEVDKELKRKAESSPQNKTIKRALSEDEFADSEIPAKVSKIGGKRAQKKGNDTEPSTPSKHKSSPKRAKESQGESSTSNDSGLVTPSRKGMRSTLNESLLNSAERSKRKLKPKVVFTMLDDPQLESYVRQLGGSVVDNVNVCTVLVTEQVKRSQKLLAAVGQGKPICPPRWIKECRRANEFLDPWDFLLVDKEAESKWKFSLSESLRRAENERLLASYTFQLMVSNAGDVLKAAIEACGGKCVTRHSKSIEGNFVIVSTPEQRNKFAKLKKQNPDPDIKVVEPEAIFDGVLRQELRLDRHLLT